MTMDVCLEPMNQPMKQEEPKRGFTLTEIAIVLGIIGLILGAIWVAAAAVYNNLRVNHANTAVLQIVQGVRALYATSNTIAAGDQTANLATAGVLPKDLVNSSGTGMIDQWPSGATWVIGNAAGDGFDIWLSAVPQNACINLLVLVGGTNGDSALYEATGGTNFTAPGTAAVSGPRIASMTPATAATSCSVVGLNGVKFGFGLKS